MEQILFCLGSKRNYFCVQYHLDIRLYFQGAKLPELTLTSVVEVRAHAGNVFPLPQNFKTSQFL